MIAPIELVIIREQKAPVRLTLSLEKHLVQSKKIVKPIVQYIIKWTILSI